MRMFLDPVGGMAGDMFAATVLDAWPDLTEAAQAVLPALDAPDEVSIDIIRHRDEAMVGTRFHVTAPRRGHARYADIRRLLQGSGLAPATRDRALAIFALLAEAESTVHGNPVDEVTFHEVGNWDSIVDIAVAAVLIEALGGGPWSVGPLPLGSGRVETAHGTLPVPAPATALLLEGFAVHDDGIPGERVTPTGAAILGHLEPTFSPTLPAQRLVRTGVAFGSRTLDGLSNVLRLFAFEPATAVSAADDVAVIAFEVDDQTPEDLAVGLDNLRATDGVLDVVQSAAIGKKGRLAAHIQVLARPDVLQDAVDACLSETTSIGLRWHLVHRSVLPRALETTDDKDDAVRVKMASRPGGRRTAKAEMDDIMTTGGGARARKRRKGSAEAAALDKRDDGND